MINVGKYVILFFMSWLLLSFDVSQSIRILPIKKLGMEELESNSQW